MPRLRDAKMQPLQTFFMQQTLIIDCFASSGKGSEQIGHSSSSDFTRPFFNNTSWFPPATHPAHLRTLCRSLRCSSLYEPSGRSRPHAPQIFILILLTTILSLCSANCEFIKAKYANKAVPLPPERSLPATMRLPERAGSRDRETYTRPRQSSAGRLQARLRDDRTFYLVNLVSLLVPLPVLPEKKTKVCQGGLHTYIS